MAAQKWDMQFVDFDLRATLCCFFEMPVEILEMVSPCVFTGGEVIPGPKPGILEICLGTSGLFGSNTDDKLVELPVSVIICVVIIRPRHFLLFLLRCMCLLYRLEAQ